MKCVLRGRHPHRTAAIVRRLTDAELPACSQYQHRVPGTGIGNQLSILDNTVYSFWNSSRRMSK